MLIVPVTSTRPTAGAAMPRYPSAPVRSSGAILGPLAECPTWRACRPSGRFGALQHG